MEVVRSIVSQSDAYAFLQSNAYAITAISFASICTYCLYKNKYGYWQRKNVNGPWPWPVFGNVYDILFKNRLILDREWVKKYGKVHGIFMGRTPRLFVADAEVLQQICIKDFDSFQNHSIVEFGHKYQPRFLFFLNGEHWKKVRALMSPTFTSGKIKRMFKFLDGCADDLIASYYEQVMLQSSGKHLERSAIVNTKDLYNLYTMNAITTCCYGLKLERTGATDLKMARSRNNFVDISLKLFDVSLMRRMMAVAAPKPLLRLLGFQVQTDSNVAPLEKTVSQLIETRRKAQKKFDDYLQSLIDAKLDDEMELDEMDQAENHHAGLTRESLLADQNKMVSEVKALVNSSDVNGIPSSITLTDLEIVANAMFLLAVGLETTGILLSNTTYLLGYHHEIQEKLYNEILKIAEYQEDKERVTFSYEALTSCKYLDSVLCESLRILAPILSIDRRANKDYHLEKYNIDIPAGTVLHLGLYATLNDPDYWQEPDKFDPERFMPGNKEKIVPGSYCPFGQGPRHCIGMRFSLTEAKLALAKMMMNFKFEPAPGTTFPPKIEGSLTLLKLEKPLVKVIPRGKQSL